MVMSKPFGNPASLRSARALSRSVFYGQYLSV